MEFSTGQNQALEKVSDWYKNSSEQVMFVGGHAGTGKTTIAKYFAENTEGKTQYGAFTGKAAVVMKKSGCSNVQTLHSLIYMPMVDPKTGKVDFVLDRDNSPLRDASLVIVDECSMVSEDLGEDLLSFNKKVLVLGDPAQLPPPKGAGYFTSGEPDVMLTEIHRQAENNPIIHLASKVRKGEKLEKGQYGSSLVASTKDIKSNKWADYDQILVGRNATRKAKNRSLRAFEGYETLLPEENDRVVCLKNEKKLHIFNGGLFTVLKTRRMNDFRGKRLVKMRLLSSDFEGFTVDVYVREEFFNGDPSKIDWKELNGTQQFDYGYALTVHKSQGSQWDNVLVFDESHCFREDKNKWLYTAITRAAESVTVLR
jgi:exodeoxyribonuclease-5